jgi:L-lysine 2,3-aminomutase
MIPRSNTLLHDHSWQWHLQHAIRDTNELAKALGIHIDKVDSQFPLLVPLPFLDRMAHGDATDPLLLQVLPQQQENLTIPGFVDDPLQELGHTMGSGIVHKYQGRILLITTGSCAINCRYCFRRHFPYDALKLTSEDWRDVASYLEKDQSIREVILSGGDPLVMPDRRLGALAARLDRLDQVTHLRIHTRMPVVIPQRVDAALLDWITQTRLQVVMVLHSNHAAELDDSVHRAVTMLREAGVTLLNQSVLLKSINDSVDDLCDLSWRLSEIGVAPYYLHQLDKVAGAAHFDLASTHALQLIEEMRARMPGYLIPRLVTEIPGETSKHEMR